MTGADFIISYNLKQQTPMIHFQSDEEGATLRASEVKPKLDRFLIAQLGGEQAVRENHSDWFISEDHPALKYKLQFRAYEGIPDLRIPHKLYFGNMGIEEEDKKRKTSFYPKGNRIKMVIICFDCNLHTEIKRYIAPFFILHAFGTRSGKGFGCFSIEDTVVDKELLKSCCPLKTYYYIEYPEAPTAEIFFDDVWVISNMMKSGFNFTSKYPDDYYKGHIFRYYTEKRIGGDKAFIKQKVLFSGKDKNLKSEERHLYTQFRFSRAMLGLPVEFKFRDSLKTSRKGSVQVKSDDVERFQSPIHFQLYDKYMLIIPHVIPEKMNNSTFNLNNKTIGTPEDFDIIDFLDSFCKRFNKKEDISKFKRNDIKNSKAISLKLSIEKIGGMQK